ncbi:MULTISPECIES: 50S ribosomal protein L10 [Paenarthrobacter]|jgi:large subunit ribosomal protein L10|uniref:Large ribosomal subunit protein uL10 n=1 Tax=Paenarthrobacter nicotinovorans TaxID=29320 RepID=A0ABT9TGQ2_PAENI|nr:MULTISPECIES: 50S ribosomal protein L10 [Paenarthrobacter]KQR06159.1 50S ribosomal protein L10 [Arthrobacter sp. Leaf145]SKB36083.1 LSU ribosomal protein L10P [Arthrobacter sp. 31Cvi3.1E]BCW11634.1 50S ribosomal protein L10 [Arthrobacter sp. NtRootA2]BCW15718.1 50S ribosomal protein L10 [Arthrobacter sp. NtRootA4]BCW24052.1 50S ribosomal protein L10 [Arthrobacter sp. NtRootC7]BCW28320.1 50S ribosomal protein L10 [Arthrobacter sp. NtRootC45]BCW32590.1 50S ribosomal protein L10 [Arthrobacte
MTTPSKVSAVAEITNDFKESNAAVLTEYRGLTVAQLKELRVALGQDTKFSVVKNTLSAIAAKEAGVEAFNDQLAGPTAIAFIKGDAVAAAKSLTDFAKANKQLVIKTGVFEGKALDAAGVAALAALESRELQLARVAGVLKAPASAAARIIDALRLKLEEEGGAPAPAADEAPAEEAAAEEVAAPAEAAEAATEEN